MRPSADPASSFVPCVARQVTFWARWFVRLWFVSISGLLVRLLIRLRLRLLVRLLVRLRMWLLILLLVHHEP